MEENTVSTQTERVCEALGIEGIILKHCHAQRPRVYACDPDACCISPIECKENEYLQEVKAYPTGPALDAAIEEKLVDKGMSWLERRDGGTVSKINGSEYSCHIWCWGRKGKGHGHTKLDARLNACEAAFCGGGK